ncbi:MAG: MATE family efflux transporter [Geminicoccaceae bacterium]
MPPYRQSFRLAVPLILSNATVPLLGMVDTAVIGRLPEPHHLGAVALGSVIMSTLMWLNGFLRIGTGGLTAQAFGAEDPDQLRIVPLRAALVALMTSLLILGTAPALMSGARLVFAPGEAVAAGMDTYLAIRIAGIPAILLTQVSVGWFLGQQRPLLPLLVMLTANGLNAVLDIVLVLKLGYGVEGVAVATVAAEYTALAIALLLARRQLRLLPRAPLPWRRIVDPAALGRFFRLSRDLVLRTLVMETVFIGFAALGTRQGELILAANAVLMNFFTLQAHGLDGFSDATEAMTGRAVGRRSGPELRDAAIAGFVNAGLLALLITAGFIAFGTTIVDLLTTIESVRETARIYLPYVMALPLVSVWAFVMDGIFFGATRARELRNAMLLSALVFVALTAAFLPHMGNHGLWAAFLIYMGTRGIILWSIYWRSDRGAGFACP